MRSKQPTHQQVRPTIDNTATVQAWLSPMLALVAVLALCLAAPVVARANTPLSFGSGQTQTANNPNITCENPTESCNPGKPGKPGSPCSNDNNQSGVSGNNASQSTSECGENQTSNLGSLISNQRFAHLHFATDYDSSGHGAGSVPSAGCFGCGSSGGAPDAKDLPSLDLQRIHRYREIHYTGSFGPGVFLNYDIMLRLDAGPNNARMIDPSALYELLLNYDATNQRYQDNRHRAIEGLRLYDGLAQLTSNILNAVTGIVTTHDGVTCHFEIIRIDAPTSNFRWGRLTAIADRNGNAISIDHVFAPDATDTELGNDRSKLWHKSAITDAYGRTATFDPYQWDATSSSWVVTRINLPNGQDVEYQYNLQPLPGNGQGAYPILGVSNVQYADGTATAVTISEDTASQTQVVHFQEAGAQGAHRNKNVYLTLETWINPNDTNDVRAISGRLVRMVANGENELSYMVWPGANGRAYMYKGGGALASYRHSGGYALDSTHYVQWDLNDNPTNYTAELSRGYAADSFRRIWRKTDILGRSTSKGLDSYTGATKSVQFPDNSARTNDFNQYRQVTRSTDRLGRITTNTFDSVGNRLSRTRAHGTPDAATWNWTYNARGQVETATDANGNVTEYNYNPDGTLFKVTEPRDNPGDPQAVTEYRYDSAKRVSTVIDPQGRITQYGYDNRDRVTSITYHDSSSESFLYGTGTEANLLVRTVDRDGYATTYDYDNTGRLTNMVEAAGTSVAVTTSYTYVDGTTLPLTMTSKGETTTYTYDYRLRLVTTTVEPTASTSLASQTVYDSADRVDHTIDPYNRKTLYVYDLLDRVTRTIRETVPGAVSVSADRLALTRDLTPNASYLIEDTTFDAEGQALTRTDARGILTTHAYDQRGRMIETVEAAGTADEARTQFVYDAQGNQTQIKHPRHFTEAGGFITEMSYTGRNLLKTQTEALGRPEQATQSFTYYLDRRAKDRTDFKGHVWTTIWQMCCARVAQQLEPVVNIGGSNVRPTTFTNYDYHGNVTHAARLTDSTGVPCCGVVDLPNAVTVNETTTRYDARHRPIAQTVWLTPQGAVDPNNVPIAPVPSLAGLTTTWTYDDNLANGSGLDSYAAGLGLGGGADGYAVAMTNPDNETSVTVYDGIGRVVRTVDGNGNATNTSYDTIVGNLVETTMADALNHTVRSRADGAGRVRETVDAENRVTVMAYDANANRLSVRDPNNVGQDCVYDNRNRDTNCTDTQGDTTSKFYDAHNNAIQTLDGFGNPEDCVFDGRDRKVQCIDRINGTRFYVYDANNNLESVTDAENNSTVYGYDARNLRVTETYPDAAPNTRTYTYDGANRLSSRLDQVNNLTQYIYDMANRLNTRSYPDSLNDTFGYDSASRLLSAVCARYNNTVTRSYDNAGRLTVETLTDAIIGSASVNYGYDAANRQTVITYPNGKQVVRGYTDRNQLSSVAYDGSSVATFAYDLGRRRETTTFGNGRIETRAYRPDNLPVSQGIPTVTGFAYGWDANKRKTQQNDSIIPQNVQDYGYDDEDRLIDYIRNNGDTQTWGLTFEGDWNNTIINGVTENRTHNEVHELTARDVSALTYDDKGNLTSNPSREQTYQWDYENRMRLLIKSGTGSYNYSYRYDALGRRVGWTRKNGTNPNGGGQTKTMAFVSAGMQEIAEYEQGNLKRIYVYGSYIDEPLMMMPIGGGPVKKYYYHANNLYSIAAITDKNGAVVERYNYSPYGEATILDPTGLIQQPASSIQNPVFFTGRRLDAETGLMYYRARYYDAQLGRFIGRDPLGYMDGLNIYLYAGNNPVNAVDPSGLASEKIKCDKCVYTGETPKSAFMKTCWYRCPASCGCANPVQSYDVLKGRDCQKPITTIWCCSRE